MVTKSFDVADYNHDVDVVGQIIESRFRSLDAESVEDCAAEIVDVIRARSAER